MKPNLYQYMIDVDPQLVGECLAYSATDALAVAVRREQDAERPNRADTFFAYTCMDNGDEAEGTFCYRTGEQLS